MRTFVAACVVLASAEATLLASSPDSVATVARDAAVALRYTQKALGQAPLSASLVQAHLGSSDIAGLGRVADSVEAEADDSGSSQMRAFEAQMEGLKQHYGGGGGGGAGAASLKSRVDGYRREDAEVRDAERREALKKSLAQVEQQVARMEVAESHVSTQAGSSEQTPAETDFVALRLRMKELQGNLQAPATSGYGDGYDAGYSAGRTQAEGPAFEINTEPVPFPLGGETGFGRQDTAHALTSSSVTESEGMVDQIEQAQSMESKRAVYRALTRLRGLAISSYDSIAKAHMANVDEYAAQHRWRETHQIRHLAEEEDDVQNWAFPMGAAASAVVPAFGAPAPAPCATGDAAPSPM